VYELNDLPLPLKFFQPVINIQNQEEHRALDLVMSYSVKLDNSLNLSPFRINLSK